MSWSNSWGGSHEAAGPTSQANVVKPANPWDALNQDQLLMLHKEKQDKLAEVKNDEMVLRKYIVNRAFPTKQEGVNTLDLGGGYELKAGVKFNYKLDPDNLKVEDALDELAKLGNEGSFIADRLVNWSASLSLTEYRKLEPQYKKIIDKVVTITDAAPTLEIKEPKKK